MLAERISRPNRQIGAQRFGIDHSPREHIVRRAQPRAVSAKIFRRQSSHRAVVGRVDSLQPSDFIGTQRTKSVIAASIVTAALVMPRTRIALMIVKRIPANVIAK